MTATWGSRLRHSLGRRHSVLAEAAAFAALYALYEMLRGLVAGDAHLAISHGQAVAHLERRLHFFLEPNIAHAAAAVPGLLAAASLAYVTLHLGVTAVVLGWLHRRRPTLYPLVRSSLVLASAVALVGYLVYPTAPPRLSGLSIPDAVSMHGIELNHGLIGALYNPYAAIPSLHVAYAAVIGGAVVLGARGRLVRLLGAAYPLLVAWVIVATGNHFFIDAGAGALVAGCSLAVAVSVLTGRGQSAIRYRPAYAIAR